MNISICSRNHDFDNSELFIDEKKVPLYPNVIDGVQEIETLLPISKFTGRREDTLSLLYSMTDKNSRLVDRILQEIPVIKSDSSISDADRFATLAFRCTDTPYDRDKFVERLSSIADDLFPSESQQNVQVVVDAAKETGVTAEVEPE